LGRRCAYCTPVTGIVKDRRSRAATLAKGRELPMCATVDIKRCVRYDGHLRVADGWRQKCIKKLEEAPLLVTEFIGVGSSAGRQFAGPLSWRDDARGLKAPVASASMHEQRWSAFLCPDCATIAGAIASSDRRVGPLADPAADCRIVVLLGLRAR